MTLNIWMILINERRWLEKATYSQVYKENIMHVTKCGSHRYNDWVDEDWIEDDIEDERWSEL